MSVRAGPVTAEDYASWLKPAAALARLPDDWEETTKRTWIGSRIKDGLIAAACSNAKPVKGAAHRGVRELDTAAWASWYPEDGGFWNTGDFELRRPGVTGYGDDELLGRFYDIRLDPYEIDKAFPREAENVPPIGRTVTPEMYETMVLAHEACSKLASHFNDWGAARATLVRRLSNSLLLSAARTAAVQDGDGSTCSPFPIIRSDHWERIATGIDSHLWITSEVDVDLRTKGRYGELEDEHSVSYLGIRFDRSGLNEIAPLFANDGSETATAAQGEAAKDVLDTEAVARASRPPGAPRKGWWDDLWIEVLRRIGDGRLTADSASSGSRLEYVLLDIAAELGFSPGDSTLKPMALKLFKYLQEIRGK